MRTRRRSGRLALLAGTALAAPPLAAGDLPVGGSVTHGAVGIATSAPGQMTITQSSENAIVSWQGFSIGEGARVDIRQPGKSSAILNRVDGPMPSRIDGRLGANGQVYLVNPNGVAIGPKGVVNAGAFVASTLAIDDDEFLSGSRDFRGGGRSAGVANHGTIDIVPGGYAALIGGRVENTGTINVPLGRIGLGAGELVTLDFAGDGFLTVAFPSEGEGDDALITHSGKISADGGSVEIKAATARHAARHAINLSGVVEARSVSGRNGAVVLGGGAGGRVTVSGRLDTSAPARQVATLEVSPVPPPRPSFGGTIDVTGSEVILAGARVEASGPDGGGTVRIGGDYKGGGGLPRARTTSVDAVSLISADALDAGDGGRIIVWSDENMSFEGTLSARGGPMGGAGGFAEVSGKQRLAFSGDVDLRAPAGVPGTLLLDPFDILITDQPSQNVFSSGDVGTTTVTGTDTPSILNVDDLASLLDGINVSVSTADPDGPDAGNITLAADLFWNSGTTLGLFADNDIIIDASITAAPFEDAAAGLVLEAENAIFVNAPVNVPTGGISIFAQNGVEIRGAVDAGAVPGSSLSISGNGVFFNQPLQAESVSVSGRLVDILGEADITAESGLGANLTLSAAQGIDVASINSGRSNVNITSGASLSFDDLSAGESSVTISAVGGIDYGSIDVSLGSLSAQSDTSGISGSSLVADDAFSAAFSAEAGNVSLGDIVAPGGEVSVSALGSFDFGDLDLGIASLSLNSGTLSATTDVGNITSTGSIVGSKLDSNGGGSLSLVAGNDGTPGIGISLNSIEWSDGLTLLLNATGDISYNSFQAFADLFGSVDVDILAGGAIDVGTTNVFNGDYRFAAQDTFTASSPLNASRTLLTVTADQIVAQGDVSAGSVDFDSRNDVSIAGTLSTSAQGPGSIDIQAPNGSIELGGMNVFGNAILGAGGSVSYDNLTIDFGSVLIDAVTDVFIGTTTMESSTLDVTSFGGLTVTGPIGPSDFAGDVIFTSNSIDIAAPISVFSLTLNANGAVAATAPIDTFAFTLSSGFWEQVSNPLPAFSAEAFDVANADLFLRTLGGDGTPGNPYLLADVYGLQGMMPESSFTLANDIDAGELLGFASLGDEERPFVGTFDGRGLQLSNFQSGEGLFGTVEGGAIRNVVISSATVDGSGDGGALAARTGSGTVVENVRVQGSEIVAGGNAGALIGTASNTLVDRVEVELDHDRRRPVCRRNHRSGIRLHRIP